jgi:methionyl aminopeptidase
MQKSAKDFIQNIGFAIQTYAEKQGFSVVRDYCGHGIGRIFHAEPSVLHYGKKNSGILLKEGMFFTIEPMINAGRREIRQLADGWTVVTRDHSLSAQWEHTILVTDTGYEVLTISEGMPAPPALIAA